MTPLTVRAPISVSRLVSTIIKGDTWLFNEVFGTSVEAMSLFNLLRTFLCRPEGGRYAEASGKCCKNVQTIGMPNARRIFLEEVRAIGIINPYLIVPKEDVELLFHLTNNWDDHDAARLICIHRDDLTYEQARGLLDADLRASETPDDMREKCREILSPHLL